MIPGDRLFGYGKKGMKRNLLSDKRRAPAGHETREKAGEIKRIFPPVELTGRLVRKVKFLF